MDIDGAGMEAWLGSLATYYVRCEYECEYEYGGGCEAVNRVCRVVYGCCKIVVE